jgi:hypothetical protein
MDRNEFLNEFIKNFTFISPNDENFSPEWRATLNKSRACKILSRWWKSVRFRLEIESRASDRRYAAFMLANATSTLD